MGYSESNVRKIVSELFRLYDAKNRVELAVKHSQPRSSDGR